MEDDHGWRVQMCVEVGWRGWAAEHARRKGLYRRVCAARNHAIVGTSGAGRVVGSSSGQLEVRVVVEQHVTAVHGPPRRRAAIARHQRWRRWIPARVDTSLGDGGEVGPLRLSGAAGALGDVLVRVADLDWGWRGRPLLRRLRKARVYILVVVATA